MPVIKMEIKTRQPYAGGQVFGDAGAYEQLDGAAQFAVDQDNGLLTPLGQVKAEAVPRSFAIDPAGRFLLSAGLETGRLATYRIGGDGRLARIATREVGKLPMWVAIISAG